MRSGAAAHHCGYFHETAFYDSDAQLLDVVVPFLAEGVAAGEPTLASLDPAHTALVRAEIDPAGIAFVPASEQYRNPTQTIIDYRRRFAGHVADGAAQIRVVGDVPHPGTGGSWDAWARYEGAVNHAFDEFPLWGLCPYDTRTTPDDVLADVRRTHRFEALPGGRHRVNPDYDDPAAFLLHRPAPAPHALQGREPDVLLHDPSPLQARTAVAGLAAPLLTGARLDDAMIAVSEVVANAVRHGAPPVAMRLWGAPGTLVVTVHDHGPGPQDPLVGLVPRPPEADGLPSGGVGLWIAGQVCTDLAFHHDGENVVRLVLQEPDPPSA